MRNLMRLVYNNDLIQLAKNVEMFIEFLDESLFDASASI